MSVTHGFKFEAPDGKQRAADALGNGRSTRIWLDLILKKHLGKCVDWSKIGKKDYLDAMIESQTNSTKIRALLKQSLTDKINDRETFMKGIDYSYYYEQEDVL